MENDRSDILRSSVDPRFIVNITCDHDYVPSAIEHIESLGAFSIIFVSLGTVLMVLTLYLTVDASYRVMMKKESRSYKRNTLIILSVYPIASLCSLVALAVPRAQLLSDAVIQIFLTISLYRLYLLLIDIGRREVKKSVQMKLRVGPCCCWPCLPFPDLEMNAANLSWVQIIVLQLPIVQITIYCIFLFMSVENPIILSRYGVFLQPLSVTSILLGLYGLAITMTSLQEVNPGSNLRHRTTVVQMVLLFSKLQCSIVRSMGDMGLFPCNPPITPEIYANFTYNSLMLIEMLFLCYAARLVFRDNEDDNDSEPATNVSTNLENGQNNNNNNNASSDNVENGTPANRINQERLNNHVSNSNENSMSVQIPARLVGVIA